MPHPIHTLAAIVLVLAAGIAAADASPSPTAFGARFSVTFPSAPTCETTELEAAWGKTPRTMCWYFDEHRARGYMAEYIVLPDSVLQAPAETLLAGAASGAAANSDSVVARQQSLEVANHPALDVTLEPNGAGHVAFVRYVLVDDHLVTITADGYTETDAPSDATAFLDSLKVGE